jgi:hypothetical protein
MKRPDSKRLYFQALDLVTEAGFLKEVDWYRRCANDHVSEKRFLRESAWVILCSGFRESIVRDIFPYISLAFFDFHSAKQIVAEAAGCIELASIQFNNRRKLQSIVDIADRINATSFRSFWAGIAKDPVAAMGELPFVGPVTSWHLAKNLGFVVSKPDRHLIRLAELFGFKTSRELCLFVSRHVDESEAVVDTVLWRASALAGSPLHLVRRLS